jgi:hypothetical protein
MTQNDSLTTRETMKYKVLVARERSGIVRDAFLRLGHDAWSCDLADCMADPARHIKGDVRDVLLDGWDILIAHPPCTYLCNSGVRWLYERNGVDINWDRYDQMVEAARFFKLFLDAPVPRIAVENPIMHGYAKKIVGREPSQCIQPYDYGHGEMKATCLWLDRLPRLHPTCKVAGREQRIHKLPPTEDRGILRSLTFPGIADAMARQWGSIKTWW